MQPIGQDALLGTLQVLPSQTQQSLAPSGGVGVCVGVLATQTPAPLQAESRVAVQPSGQEPSIGDWQVLLPHWQQSFGPRVGFLVGVGVLATQAPASVQAESRCGVQLSGQPEFDGTEQVLPWQMQQSLAPRVGVGVGVTVLATQPTSATQAELKTGAQSCGQAALAGTAHWVPAH